MLDDPRALRKPRRKSITKQALDELAASKSKPSVSQVMKSLDKRERTITATEQDFKPTPVKLIYTGRMESQKSRH
jgi:hypothetical protein